jgi:hypothetical protein
VWREERAMGAWFASDGRSLPEPWTRRTQQQRNPATDYSYHLPVPYTLLHPDTPPCLNPHALHLRIYTLYTMCPELSALHPNLQTPCPRSLTVLPYLQPQTPNPIARTSWREVQAMNGDNDPCSGDRKGRHCGAALPTCRCRRRRERAADVDPCQN